MTVKWKEVKYNLDTVAMGLADKRQRKSKNTK